MIKNNYEEVKTRSIVDRDRRKEVDKQKKKRVKYSEKYFSIDNF